MNKYILPSAAALLILVIAVSSVSPAIAVARITLAPYLVIQTIPEDDQIHNTGVMILGSAGQKLWSQFKILITLQGVPVSTTGLVISCNVAEKDKELIPPDVPTGKPPTINRQFQAESVKTVVKDVADYFVCKPRWKSSYVEADNSKWPGVPAHWASEGFAVGVLDVYYTGTDFGTTFIADHILVVHATYTVGRQVFYGTEIQDICVLGHSEGEMTGTTTIGGVTLNFFGDPLGEYASCDMAVLDQLYGT
jgi:hypothetical protein